jgi:hypothetical protein
VARPKDILLQGCKILDLSLLSKGFQFHFRGEGPSSGGGYAWGEYAQDERRLELHFRYSLGLVRYHAGSYSVSHEAYMRQLGALPSCQYPGFSSDPMHAFHALAHDLQFADDFFSGTASMLKKAAEQEAVSAEKIANRERAKYAGDTKRLAQMRLLFKQRKYEDVVSLFAYLKYPHQLTRSELRIVELARKRSPIAGKPWWRFWSSP